MLKYFPHGISHSFLRPVWAPFRRCLPLPALLQRSPEDGELLPFLKLNQPCGSGDLLPSGEEDQQGDLLPQSADEETGEGPLLPSQGDEETGEGPLLPSPGDENGEGDPPSPGNENAVSYDLQPQIKWILNLGILSPKNNSVTPAFAAVLHEEHGLSAPCGCSVKNLQQGHFMKMFATDAVQMFSLSVARTFVFDPGGFLIPLEEAPSACHLTWTTHSTLVGALSARCIVTKDGSQPQLQESPAVFQEEHKGFATLCSPVNALQHVHFMKLFAAAHVLVNVAMSLLSESRAIVFDPGGLAEAPSACWPASMTSYRRSISAPERQHLHDVGTAPPLMVNKHADTSVNAHIHNGQTQVLQVLVGGNQPDFHLADLLYGEAHYWFSEIQCTVLLLMELLQDDAVLYQFSLRLNWQHSGESPATHFLIPLRGSTCVQWYEEASKEDVADFRTKSMQRQATMRLSYLNKDILDPG